MRPRDALLLVPLALAACAPDTKTAPSPTMAAETTVSVTTTAQMEPRRATAEDLVTGATVCLVQPGAWNESALILDGVRDATVADAPDYYDPGDQIFYYRGLWSMPEGAYTHAAPGEFNIGPDTREPSPARAKGWHILIRSCEENGVPVGKNAG